MLKPKKLINILIAFGAVVFILLSGEIVYFYYILSQNKVLKKADVIVVFAGSDDRIKASFGLANDGYAPNIIVSPATENQMEAYASMYVATKNFSWFIEDKARTTFENATFIKNILLKNNFKSVILVTSYYHLPRSSFLMKAAVLGRKIRIQPYGNSIGSNILNRPSQIRINDSMIANELIKFWGSLLEALNYKTFELLPFDN